MRNVWLLLSDCATGFSDNDTTWLPVNRNYLWLNLEAQKVAPKSHYKVYQQLTELRKKPAIQRGDTEVAALSERVLAFTRCLSYSSPIYSDFRWYRQFSGGGSVVLFRSGVLLDYGEKISANKFLSWYLLRKVYLGDQDGDKMVELIRILKGHRSSGWFEFRSNIKICYYHYENSDHLHSIYCCSGHMHFVGKRVSG